MIHTYIYIYTCPYVIYIQYIYRWICSTTYILYMYVHIYIYIRHIISIDIIISVRSVIMRVHVLQHVGILPDSGYPEIYPVVRIPGITNNDSNDDDCR